MTARQLKSWLRYLLALGSHYSGMDQLYRWANGPGLVVLMLHRLRDEDDPQPLSISVDSLEDMLSWLRRRNALVGLDDGLGALEERNGRKTLYAITLDDGYRDNLGLIDGSLEAVPAIIYMATQHIGEDPVWIYRLVHAVESRTSHQVDLSGLGLGQYNLSDAFDRRRLLAQAPPCLKLLAPYELEGWIDNLYRQTRPYPESPKRHAMLDWDDARKLHAHGIQIGAHTRHHVLLSQVDEATAREEIEGSRDDIAVELGNPPLHFAYPNGTLEDFGERDMHLVKQAGFRTATTTIEGVNRHGVDPFRLLRYNVHESRFLSPFGHQSLALFYSETSGLLGWFRARIGFA